MLPALQSRCTLEQIDYVKVLVAHIGCVRMLEACSPILQQDPELIPALAEMHKAGIIAHQLPYNPEYVAAKGWASFYERNPVGMRPSVSSCCFP